MPDAAPTVLATMQRYAVALLTVVAASLVKWWLDPWVGQETPFLFFLGAVMVSAWVGGLGPGLLATAASAVVADSFFLDPYEYWSVRGGLGPTLRMLLFLLEGTLISWLAASLL